MATRVKDGAIVCESELVMKKGLSATEVDHRLMTLATAHRRIESALCFYLQEVEERQLYIELGHASTVDYARERLGFEDRKTWSLLQIARRFKVLPEMKKAFSKGTIPWTKAREAVKAATPETDRTWVTKCLEMTNRQIEKEVKQTLPPVKKKTVVLVLEGDMLDVWEQAREACERLAGKTLNDIEVFDLMCAEVLCTYATTPPFDPEKDDDGGAVRSIAERDGWRCTRPGCRSRTALQGDHIVPRSQGGRDRDWNKTTLGAVCHHAKTTGILKVSGRAPNGLTWEGPFGVIEKPLPLPLPQPKNGTGASTVREGRASYDARVTYDDSRATFSLGAQSRDRYRIKRETLSDHVIAEGGKTRRNAETAGLSARRCGKSKKNPSRPLLC